ncbi:MAG: hypothetical protein Unbinned5784contig1000_18 [Prokaryotic dsDNA virus sp.]|nr:MAG: hypothetical protein Unbinned5784contig1000_18 [Prokaryotic dsDNA virus sp.]
MESEEAQVKTPMDELLEFHMVFTHAAYQLCERKNHDYAGAQGQSPFRNFETVEALGLASTETGIVIRMADKINRLVTFARDGKLKVANESASDALLDIVNYAVILAAYIRKRANQQRQEDRSTSGDSAGE